MTKGLSEILEMNKKLLDFVDDKFKPKLTDWKTALRVVSLFLFAKSTKTFRALTVLCSKGYGEDAVILARSILENLICLTYIQKDESQHRAELFMYHSFIDHKEKAEQIKDDYCIKEYIEQTNVKLDDDFEGNYNKAIKMRKDECEKIKKTQKYKVDRYSWSGLSIRDMAIETELKDFYYDQVYWLISQFSHPNPSASYTYLKIKEDGLNIIDKPNEKWVKQALTLGFDCYLKIILLVNEVFSLGFENEITKLGKEYVEIAG